MKACKRCGADLTDPFSRLWGYGPECKNHVEVLERATWLARLEARVLLERDDFKRWLLRGGHHEAYCEFCKDESTGQMRDAA